MIATKYFLTVLSFVLIQHSALLIGQEDEYLVKRFKDHKDVVLSVAFSPDGKYLVSGGEDKLLIIYDLSNNEIFRKFDENYFPPRAIEVTQVNQMFLGSGPDIKLIDLENNTLAVYEGNTTHIWSIDYAPERNKVTAGSYDYTIKVWNVATTELELELEGHKKSTLPVTFSPDEKYLVSGSLDRTIKIWNAKTGELLRTLEGHTDNIYAIAFHPGGHYFASASRDHTVRLWDFETGEIVQTYSGHDQGVVDIAFLPDGNHLISASFDGSIRLWQTKTGKMVYTFAGHEGPINSIAVNNEGTMLASGGVNKEVLLWEISRKIFVEYAYYEQFFDDKAANSLFDERRKGEKKEDYEIRMEKARAAEKELVDTYYGKYMSSLRAITFSK